MDGLPGRFHWRENIACKTGLVYGSPIPGSEVVVSLHREAMIPLAGSWPPLNEARKQAEIEELMWYGCAARPAQAGTGTLKPKGDGTFRHSPTT